MSRLPLGKLPIAVLNRSVLRASGAVSSALKTGPEAGVDFAAIKFGRGFVIVSADPITGVSSNVGRYAVNVSANDVATSGNRPRFLESVLLLPENATEELVGDIAADMHKAARELGITIVGGHTEVTPGLQRPIAVTTAFAFAKRYVSSATAREGDVIMMTKTAGLEGTAILASRADLPAGLAQRAMGADRAISVVREACEAFLTGRVDAMHDCTEGGVLGAVYEMSLASDLGFEMRESAVPVSAVTKEVCTRLGVDALKLIGSGSLLIAVKSRDAASVKKAIRPFVEVTEIGEFVAEKRTLLQKDGSRIRVREAPPDELWRILPGAA